MTYVCHGLRPCDHAPWKNVISAKREGCIGMKLIMGAGEDAQPTREGPLQVFLTIDTEVWPQTPNWRETGLSQDIRRDIYGAALEGEFGLPFQMDLLDAHGLKAVFFVEAL